MTKTVPGPADSYDLLRTREQAAIKHIVATIFSAQDALRDLAPEQRWAGMGNLLGDYGEYVALVNYNLKKAPGGADGYDAITREWVEGSDQGKPLIVHNRLSRAGRFAVSVEGREQRGMERDLLWAFQTSSGESQVL